MSFTKLGLNDSLLKAVEKEGYTIPTPIQEQAIPVLLAGKDVLGTAQTGTGKTAAFALPMIQMLMSLPRPEKRVVRALIVVPTRELAVQIQESFMTLSRFSNLRIGMFFGGVSKFGQINLLRQGVDIAVATPGRLLDLMRDRAFHPNHIKMVVLDEADQMLDMGFLPDVKTILQSIPKPRHSALFSATMPEQIANLASSFLVDPVRIAITPVSQPLNKIVHQTIKIEKNQKLSLLIHLLKNPELKSVLVFMRTKRGAKRTALNLTHQGHTVVELHGNQSQAQRQFAMKKFKEKHVRILVATDLASRGIDIHQLTHVVNFDMPETAEAFLHRTGRTGRAGFSGDVINLVSREEASLLHMINRHTGMSLTPSILKDFVFDSSLVVHGGGDDEGDRPRYQSRERSGQRSYGSSRSSGRGYGSSQTPTSFGNPSSSSPDGAKPYEGARPPRRYDNRPSSSGSRLSGYQGRNPREPGQSSGYQGRTPREPGQSSGYQGRNPREGGSSSNYEGKKPSYQSRNSTFKKRNP